MRHAQQDLTALFPEMDLSRRGFVVTTIAAGFALTVQPTEAAIITDTNGITAGAVKIKVADGEIPAYRAQPNGKGPFCYYM